MLVLLSRLAPLWLLYILVAPLITLLVRRFYRHSSELVASNLKRCFPSLSEREIQQLVGRNYRYFGVLLVELLKAPSMSDKSLRRRISIRQPELIRNCFDNHDVVILASSHYGCWEWAIHRTALEFDDLNCSCIYRPTRNRSVNRLILDGRRKRGIENISEKNLIPLRHEKNIRRLLMFGFDQSPAASTADQIWTPFFNQETPFYQGMERLPGIFRAAVCYVSIHQLRRGHYEIRPRIIRLHEQADDRKVLPQYAKALEATIRECPEHHLWLRRLWKRERRADEILLCEEAEPPRQDP